MQRMRIAALLVLALGIAVPAGANHDTPVAPDVFPKIRELVNPLAGAPAFVRPGDTLTVEMDWPAAPPVFLDAQLVPSFSELDVHVDMISTTVAHDVVSGLWPERAVSRYTYTIPAFDDGFVEDLYDLNVSWGAGRDTQHRAVKVIEEFPEHPRVVVLADPSVGDPRPIQEGAEELAETGDPSALIDKTTKTFNGAGTWHALRSAIDEINMVQPDFVLVTGDLTFAVYPRAANYEYEEAFSILSTLQVPAFLNPGNHDLYNFDYDDLDRPHTSDGWELWRLYFGPLYYSVDIGPDLHLVSINTYDWPASEREPFDENDEFSTRAGGQVRAEQFAWLSEDLNSTRTRNPDGAIVTFAHHDPSWIQARHPWPGERRLEVRDLLASMGVGAHFSGHTHEDRVARYHEGHIVETNGRRAPHGVLHRVDRHTGQNQEGYTQDELGAILHDPAHGPVFVSTTTVSSVLKGSDWGLGSYWGWRYGTLVRAHGGYDPVTLGYPATREFLDEHAERPANWNPDHAEFGVFSYPSYHLRRSIERTPYATFTRYDNDLLVPMELIHRALLPAIEGDVHVFGGTLLRTRTDGDAIEVWVSVPIQSESHALVAVGIG